MIVGTRVQATLWEVHFRHLSAAGERTPEPRAKARSANPVVLQMSAAIAAAERDAGPYVYGRCFVVTADPTGSDLLPIVRCAVLGAGGPEHDFSLVQVQRVADEVKGSALVVGALS